MTNVCEFLTKEQLNDFNTLKAIVSESEKGMTKLGKIELANAMRQGWFETNNNIRKIDTGAVDFRNITFAVVKNEKKGSYLHITLLCVETDKPEYKLRKFNYVVFLGAKHMLKQRFEAGEIFTAHMAKTTVESEKKYLPISRKYVCRYGDVIQIDRLMVEKPGRK